MTDAPKSLERARVLVSPALAAAAALLAPELRRLVEYHWGWVDADGRPTASRSGKGLRPTLAILSAEACGAPADVGLAGAVAVELIHDFTLLHDDVMDGDRMRRGRPSTWAVFGTGPAICAGDALVLLAQRVLLEDRSPGREAALASLGSAASTVIAGQMLDLALEGRVDAGVEEYLRMAGQKTAALLGCAASIGARLADATQDRVDALQRFGESLGLAFQIVDDWLGIWGDPARTGKPVASDLRRRKSSLPVVLALRSTGAAGRALRAYMRSDRPPSESDVACALEWLEACRAEPATRQMAEHELARARAHLDAARLEEPAREELLELAAFTIQREL